MKPPDELERLRPGARGQAALDPRLLTEQNAEPPLHDVVVVDHQHAKTALGKPRGRAGGQRASRAASR
jgi:hypothetical protein